MWKVSRDLLHYRQLSPCRTVSITPWSRRSSRQRVRPVRLSNPEFDEIINGLPADRLLVVDFHATWCGPCKAIAPFVDRLADKYPDVEFVKIDVDQVKELAKRYKVSAMPTFKLFKGGKEVAQVGGSLGVLISDARSCPAAAGETRRRALGGAKGHGGRGHAAGRRRRHDAPEAAARGRHCVLCLPVVVQVIK